MKKLIILLFCVFCSTGAFSDEKKWIDTQGKVKKLSTYAHTETVLVYLDNPGQSISQCTDTTAFAISHSISSEARSRMFSLLLAAKAAGTPVTVSYLNTGDCEPWDASTSAYRKITRIR